MNLVHEAEILMFSGLTIKLETSDPAKLNGIRILETLVDYNGQEVLVLVDVRETPLIRAIGYVNIYRHTIRDHRAVSEIIPIEPEDREGIEETIRTYFRTNQHKIELALKMLNRDLGMGFPIPETYDPFHVYFSDPARNNGPRPP